MNRKIIIPEIRFYGFTTEWKRSKLGEVSSIYDGTHQTPDYKDNGIMFLSVENIKTLKSEKYITLEAFNKEFKVRPEKNDILMTRIGDVGTANVVVDDIPIAYYVSLALLKPKVLNSYFLKASIHSPFMQNEIWKRTLHIAFPKKINKNEISKVPINYPKLEEQLKIGSFFKQFDEAIVLQQQLLDDHKQLKKAMLQKMFPQKGESVPRVRFAGFVSKWNEDKIENLLIERNERSGEGELISVTTNFGVVKAADLKRTDNSSKDKSNYKKVEKGDIAYNSMRMWQGASGLSKYTGIVSPAYTIIIPKENVSPLFISYLFKLPSIIQTFQANSQGLTSDTWNLKYPMLKKIKIKVPELKEQQKISIFFKQLDKTINFHEKKLETYRELKKAMLQKMFV